jgi:hypothetical protein
MGIRNYGSKCIYGKYTIKGAVPVSMPITVQPNNLIILL